MMLIFGKKTIDTKGLPRIAVINSQGFSDGTTCVFVLLESRTRVAVEKWAKRLGVDVAEAADYSAGEREISAEAESAGNRLCVYTYVPVEPVESAGGAS